MRKGQICQTLSCMLPEHLFTQQTKHQNFTVTHQTLCLNLEGVGLGQHMLHLTPVSFDPSCCTLPVLECHTQPFQTKTEGTSLCVDCNQPLCPSHKNTPRRVDRHPERNGLVTPLIQNMRAETQEIIAMFVTFMQARRGRVT